MRKFYQKQLSPEYHFIGIECTVGRNPSDGRKRVHCPDKVKKDLQIFKLSFRMALIFFQVENYYQNRIRLLASVRTIPKL